MGGGVQLPLLPVLYGLDIETDTTVNGLDPACAAIVAVGVSGDAGDVVFRGPERRLLRALDRWLRRMPAGVIVTWNGSGFDLPFLTDRAARLGVRLGLQLTADTTVETRHPPLPGHAFPYQARWYRHVHLDACCAYRSLLAGTRESFSLKPLARDTGLTVVEVDRCRIHELPAALIDEYVASDARLARLLAARRWLDAAAFVDAPLLVQPAS